MTLKTAGEPGEPGAAGAISGETSPEVQLSVMVTGVVVSSLYSLNTVNEPSFTVFVIVHSPTASSAAWQVPGGSPLPL